MGTTTYRVDGMTCNHCISAVTTELMALDGVSAVTVDLSAGGTSTVTVTGPTTPPDDMVANALAEAGDYQLVASPA